MHAALGVCRQSRQLQNSDTVGRVLEVKFGVEPNWIKKYEIPYIHTVLWWLAASSGQDDSL